MKDKGCFEKEANKTFYIVRDKHDKSLVKYISHTTYGKVILILNQARVHEGRAVVTSFQEFGRYILANMRNLDNGTEA